MSMYVLYQCNSISKHGVIYFSWKQTLNIHGLLFIFSLPLTFYTRIHPGYFVEIVSRIFPLAVNQKIFFFKHEVLPVILGHFKIGNKLNGISRTGFLTISAKNTA